MSNKTIEETYKKLSQREHILMRSGMYIGSTKKQLEDLWVAEEYEGSFHMKKQMVEYTPGFMKIFDEILTNATDHAARDSTVNIIKVDFSKDTGEITVWNNGKGIPVVLHKDHNMYVPELIFGHFLSGSNYDDTQSRTGAGTNGIGSKAVAVYSKRFVVETIDSENQKKFVQEFTDNMANRTKPKVTSNSGKSYTKITFVPDYSRFGMKSLEDDTISLITKRVLDCIACTDSHVQVYLNGKKLKGKGLVDYTKYFFQDQERIISDSYNYNQFIWEWVIVPSESFEQISFVNGNSTTQGGKHVDFLLNQIVSKLKVLLETKKKLKDVKPSLIKERLFLFLRATIVNPSFNSQTKEYLTTPSKDFGCRFEVSDKFIEKLYKSSIVEDIIQTYKLKESLELAKTTNGKKVSRIFIPKLEDALWAGTAKSDQCTLVLTEGLSAMTFALHGRATISTEKLGIFPLKGKILNIKDATSSQLMNNEEINNIKKIIGLQENKIYENTKDLRYGKVMLLTDADSVVGNTPLLLKDTNNNIMIETIERLTSNYTKNELNDKEYGHSNYEIWTENGWTKIKHIIRHKVTKNIYRVLTHTGLVDVTEDHSLLNEYGHEIAPKDCQIGDKLLHNFPIIENNKIFIPENLNSLSIRELWKLASLCKIPYYQNYKKIELINKIQTYKNQITINLNNYVLDKNEAYVMGLFWADGSSGIYTRKNTDYYLWSICNSNLKYLEEAKKTMENLYGMYFKIRSLKSNNSNNSILYKLDIFGGKKIKHIVEKYTELFYYKDQSCINQNNGNKRIPALLLNSDQITREKFLEGFYNGDGEGHDLYVNTKRSMDIYGKIGAQGMFWLCKSLGYEVSINIRTDKPDVIRLIITKGTQQLDKDKIKKIINLGKTNQYVYDLETENHHFQAGVGQLIVHNTDGSHIKSLFVNFIHTKWPSLLKMNPPFIQTMKTPIVKVKRGNQIIEFFTEQDYHSWKETIGDEISRFNIKYFKGLGTSKKEDAIDLFKRYKDLTVDYYYKNDKCNEAILLAFDKDKNVKNSDIKCSDKRKVWLSRYDKNSYLKMDQRKVSYQDLIEKELIHFSIYDNVRSIPHLIDGLKPSQRKILWYMLEKKITRDIKVAQLSGYVSAETSYHHGEASLQGAIIGMAQDFVGSNNLALLAASGNFGSRYLCGKDAASPRYIFTYLHPWTICIFDQRDSPLLNYLNDDGQSIEPDFFVPIIPLALVNGCEGIGTGFSTYIPPHNPQDLIENLLRILDDQQPIPMRPYFKGFNGIVEEQEGKEGTGWTTRGVWKKISSTQIEVTELPIGLGVTSYKEFLEGMIEGGPKKKGDTKEKEKPIKIPLRDVKNNTKDENSAINFLVEFKSSNDLEKLITSGTLEKELKLTKSFTTTNMYLFDESLIPTKYLNTTDILLDFYDIRLDMYARRRAHLISQLKKELTILKTKVRFIREYISGDLDINRKSKNDIFSLLEKKGYSKHPEEQSYDFLIRMQIASLTKEKIEELDNQTEEKERELKELQTKTEKDLWKEDLVKLKSLI